MPAVRVGFPAQRNIFQRKGLFTIWLFKKRSLTPALDCEHPKGRVWVLLVFSGSFAFARFYLHFADKETEAQKATGPSPFGSGAAPGTMLLEPTHAVASLCRWTSGILRVWFWTIAIKRVTPVLIPRGHGSYICTKLQYTKCVHFVA